MTEDTLAVGSFNLILLAARQRGADPDALIQAVGVRPDALGDPDGRVPVRAVQALWYEAIRATGDPGLPIRLGGLINPLSMGVLAYVMMHCSTLGGAIEKLCQYQDVACEGVRTTGHREGNRFVLSLELTSSAIQYPEYTFASELSVYLAAFAALTGQRVTAQEVRFACAVPPNLEPYEAVLNPAHLVFNASQTALVLDAAWLEAPVLNASPELFDFFDRHADGLLRRLTGSGDGPEPYRRATDRRPGGTPERRATDRVREQIITLLKGEEPALPVVADRLAMGVRTLQLHLKAEGITYRQLVEEARRELAEAHLREPYLSTTDIAYLLGFSEPSVFYRSFRKWTGQTPGAFRDAARQQMA